MHILRRALVLLLLSGFAAPTLAQGIPDYIPDTPGESLIDRELERMAERYRSTLSGFYSLGTMDMAPVTGEGLGYQATFNVGYRLESGDALFLSFASRDTPFRYSDEPFTPESMQPVLFAGAGYELSGMRFFGESFLGYRSHLGMSLGLIAGDVEAVALDISPTFDVMQKHNFVVPVGIRLSVAATRVDARPIARAFLGLNVGVRYHWLSRDRLD